MSTPSTSQPADLDALFGAAVGDGTIDQGTLDDIGIIDLGQGIQDGFGIDASMIEATEVILVGTLIDDSGSIRFAGNSQIVRDGNNLVIDALNGAGSKSKDGILMMTRYLNGTILFPFVPIGQAVRMDSSNYDPNGGTPLYDQTAIFLATMMAKCQEFLDLGIDCRTISLIVTDGDDCGSHRQTAATNNALIGSMLRAERHIIAGMGIEDKGGRCDFRAIFKDMGILDEWVLVPGDSEKEIRAAFHTFSQSAVRASRAAAGPGFSTAAGGFGNN